VLEQPGTVLSLALLDTLCDSGSPACLTAHRCTTTEGDHADAHTQVFVTNRRVVDRARELVAPEEK